MRLRFFAVAALCVAAGLISPAFAKPRLAQASCNGFDIMRPCEAVRSQPERFSERAAPRHRAAVKTSQRPSQGFAATVTGFGGDLVSRARSYLGRTGPSLGLPGRLWCSDFMNMITGGGTGSRLAKSWLSHQRVSPQVGAVVVTGRRGGGHVGVVAGFTTSGDVIVVSGNHGRRVGEGVYSRSRVIAFVSAS